MCNSINYFITIGPLWHWQCVLFNLFTRYYLLYGRTWSISLLSLFVWVFYCGRIMSEGPLTHTSPHLASAVWLPPSASPPYHAAPAVPGHVTRCHVTSLPDDCPTSPSRRSVQWSAWAKYKQYNNNNNLFIWYSATSIIVCGASQHITI